MILGAPSTPAQQAQQPLTFTVDQEHGALRFGVFVVFIATWVIGYFLFNSVIANDGLNIIAIGLGFGFAYVLTNLAERYLKRSWPSGRRRCRTSCTVSSMPIRSGGSRRAQPPAWTARPTTTTRRPTS